MNHVEARLDRAEAIIARLVHILKHEPVIRIDVERALVGPAPDETNAIRARLGLGDECEEGE